MTGRIDEIKKRIKQVEHLQNKKSERILVEMDIPWMVGRIEEMESLLHDILSTPFHELTPYDLPGRIAAVVQEAKRDAS